MMESGALRNIVENGRVNRTVVVENTVEVRSEDCHVFFAIGRELPSAIFMAIFTFFCDGQCVLW